MTHAKKFRALQANVLREFPYLRAHKLAILRSYIVANHTESESKAFRAFCKRYKRFANSASSRYNNEFVLVSRTRRSDDFLYVERHAITGEIRQYSSVN